MKRLPSGYSFELAVAALLVALAGCSGSETGSGETLDAPRPVRIGAGEWMVASRDDSTAVLIRYPADSPAGRGQQDPADSIHTILYHESGDVSVADIDSLILPVSDSSGGVAPAFAIVEADALRLAVIPGRSPTLVQSPGKPDVHLFESIDGIWGIDADLLPEPITSRRVGVYDYAQLRGRQREGEVILYWATAPIWSPSGDVLAFATNREAVYREQAGQSIWTIDLESRLEKPLVQEDGRSFRPVGWLGDEVVFIGDMPGVWAADSATGGRREVAHDATFVDWARDGSAIALAYGVPDSTRLQVVRTRDGTFQTTDVPNPPPGYTYLPDALFSPDGTRLLLSASAEGGLRRNAWIFELATGSIAPVPATAGLPTGPPSWVVNDAILVHVKPDAASRTEAWILPVGDLEGMADAIRETEQMRAAAPPRPFMVLPVQPGEPGEVREHMQALIEGTLDLRTSCVRIRPSNHLGSDYLLIWPPGYTARARDLAILDERGEVFARVGDRVQLGGGEVPQPPPGVELPPGVLADPASLPRESGCAGPYWIVGEVLKPATSGAA